MTNTIIIKTNKEIILNENMIYNLNFSKKQSIIDKITWLLDDEYMTKSNFENELENIEDEISEYRDNESDEWEDLTFINDLLSNKEDVEFGINRCELEIERYYGLLNKLKVKKNTDEELDKFCSFYHI
jgi:hypothetical protein